MNERGGTCARITSRQVPDVRAVLRGVKVVEVAQWWFTPSAAVLLAEWGAEVIKVEHPLYGDPIRGLTTSGGLPGSYNVNFMLEQCNHGKRSIGLNIASPEGRKILDQLIGQADVLLTSFLPAVRRKLRLEVEDVRAVNPRIIYARGHGAGDRGPEREQGGFDAASFWARGAVAHHHTPPGADAPVMPRPSFGDGISGLAMAGAVAAALYARDRHGGSSPAAAEGSAGRWRRVSLPMPPTCRTQWRRLLSTP